MIEKSMVARKRPSSVNARAHFEQVVKKLADRFNDLVLCKAGALHGIESDKWDSRESAGLIEFEVKALLEERAQLRSLESKPDMVDRLTTYVLPEIRDLRSVLLLIVEQLCHFDPDDEMAAWARDFFDRPPGLLPQLLDPEGNFDSVEAHLAFLNNVIAPMCAYFGFWREKWLAKDLWLFHTNRDRLDAIRKFVAASWTDGQVESRLSYLQALLQGEDTAGEREPFTVHWEWRSPSAMTMILPEDINSSAAYKLISRCGYLIVTCETDAECYQALGRLHRKSQHRFGEIRDFIGAPAPSGYRALHTELTRKNPNDTVLVHITPKSSVGFRYEFTGSLQLQKLEEQRGGRRSFSFRVFTKDGQPLELPVGSCVLNFALKVHSDFIALARKATVNRKPVDLLHRLQPGDVVWLEIGDIPNYLPDGWEERVPANTISRIRKEFRRCFRPALMAQGWIALRRRLANKSRGYRNADETLLVAAIRNADFLLKAKGTIHELKHEDRWLRQLALLDTEIQGGSRLHRLEIDEAIANDFVEKIAAEIDKIPNLDRRILDLPDSFHGRFDRIDFSQISPNARTMKAVIENRILRLLPADSDQGETIRRITSRQSPIFFLIECRKRLDLLPQLLATIQEEGGDILDVAANWMAAGWGVIRVHVQMLDRASIERLRERISQLPNVGRVTGPGKPPPPFPSSFLPPKEAFSTDPSVDLPLPFRAGAPVRREHFYGRVTELKRLEEILEGRLDQNAGNGIVFVTGPLREGKSSLVNEFLDRTRLRTALPGPLLTATVESAGDSSWTSASREIGKKLWDKAEQQAELWEPLMATRSDDLQTTIEMLQKKTNCIVILVFDEVIKLVSMIEKAGEAQDFERFWTWANHREGLMVIFIGPLAPLKVKLELGSDLARLLNNTIRIQLSALDEQLTASLLQAEKQRPAIQIRADKKTQRRVFRLTGGQPMWIQKLAEAMFVVACQRSNSGQVAFRHKDCELAYQRIAGDLQIQRSLEDRVFHAVEDPARVQAVLEALVACPRDSQDGAHLDGIVRYLNHSLGDEIPSSPGLDRKQLSLQLLELQELGALISRVPDRWQFASELVERFVEEKLKSSSPLRPHG